MINNTITKDSDTFCLCLFPLTPEAKISQQSKTLVLTKPLRIHRLPFKVSHPTRCMSQLAPSSSGGHYYLKSLCLF